MTDKELRKLSRLELLELLLEASKENKKLKEQIETLKAENATAQNIRNLSDATLQVENALRYANSLTDNLKGAPHKAVTVRDENPGREKNNSVSDRDIYWRIMGFYSKNPEAALALPEKLRSDVSARIQEVLRRINK